ncbi:MAG: acyltransferase [Halieaceae bacterium]|nr:acyltransferase [Halieaceae bacterium]
MSKTRRQLTYLPDIDGLRAIAVLAVILFHLKVPGFDGGYVGVDIFFVISGFLISGLIRDRVETGTFSFSDFYARRISRLLPAVLATVGATAIAAIFILQPDALGSFALSAAAAVFSAANFVFYFESGYWDASAELKPLLHLWSLGIEEQFYLFWPGLMLLLANTSRATYQLGLIAIFITSLLACVIQTPVDSAATFYLLPFRVWQFALGAMAIEIWRNSALEPFMQLLIRSTGLALCGFSIATFSAGTAYPGWHALLPSIGAALVLISAHPTEGSVWLANSSARWLGRLSYSLYLAHWPPIALYRCYSLSEPTTVVFAILAAASFVLAIALHYGVERVFYSANKSASAQWQNATMPIIAAACLLAFLMTLVSISPDRFIEQKNQLSAEIIEGYKSRRFKLAQNTCRIDQLGKLSRCPMPNSEAILFLGNSHETDGFNIVTTALGPNNRVPLIRFGTSNGCLDFGVDNSWATSADATCQERLDAIRTSLESITWRAVIYSSRKPYALHSEPFVYMLETLKEVQPKAEIVIFEDYLMTRIDCAYLINRYGSSKSCGEIEHIRALPGLLDPGPIEKRAAWQDRLEALDPVTISKVQLLCREALPDSCATETPDGHPFAVDRHHLTLEFSQWVGEQLRLANPTWLQRLKNPQTERP